MTIEINNDQVSYNSTDDDSAMIPLRDLNTATPKQAYFFDALDKELEKINAFYKGIVPFGPREIILICKQL